GHTFLTFINGSGYGVFRSTTGAKDWANINGTIHAASGTSTSTSFPSLNWVVANPKRANTYAVSSYAAVFTTLDGGANWQQSAPPTSYGFTGIAFDPNDSTGKPIWTTTGSTSGDHVLFSTDQGLHWTVKDGSGASAIPDVPAKTIKVDPGDSNTVYVGTELGLYRTQDKGTTWARMGKGLPLVSVTEISVALDSSAIRISTFGRGFWEVNPRGTVDAGVWGKGDMDHNAVIDGFDLVAQARLMLLTPADPSYDNEGTLTGNTNQIDGADADALRVKLGGRP
ncbi:MAG: hypothetical protein JST92_11955, partial [Deltaproteobacteria bacterium]|nr:hypothetical protein [Deltaproteobacteria bacterium]